LCWYYPITGQTPQTFLTTAFTAFFAWKPVKVREGDI
jgi:hypothetical protein